MKKILSLFLAVLMIASCSAAAFAAQSFSGTYSEDITILSGAAIADGTVFNGNVTIADGAVVSGGIFNGAVINNSSGKFLDSGITGGTFKNTVTNNGTISGGTFSGTVTNIKTISGGEFKNTVTNNGTISGGTFNKAVTNKSGATINSGTFNGTVTNENGATITYYLYIYYPDFYGEVINAGTIKYGNFYNCVVNSGTFSASTAVVKEGSAYRVVGSPVIKSKLVMSGSGTTFTISKGSILTIDENTEMDINCPATVNGTIILSKGAKLVSNGGSLVDPSNGKITVPLGSSFTGTSASKFSYITYKEYEIKVESNVDANQYSFTAAKSAYKGSTVSYVFDLAGTYSNCLTLNSIKVYKGRKNDSNIINASADISDNFTMPDDNVIIYIDCIANHTPVSAHADAKCEQSGYDKTYCQTCQHTLSYTEIPAKGHIWSAWKYADEGSRVLKTRTCSECQKTDNAYIEIVNETAGVNLTADYKSSFVFHANAKAEAGYTVTWYVTQGGKTEKKGTGTEFRVDEAVDSFKVSAVITGTAIGSSETLNITVKHGFFDKFIAFFRGLFKKLPVYIDNVKQ